MKNVVIALALGVSATSAFAESNLYAEMLVGLADQNAKTSGASDDASGDDTSLGIRGGYQFNDYVAVELSYQNYGEANDTYIDNVGNTINNKLETTAINVGVKGMIPFGNGFSLNGRLGLSSWDFEGEETDSAFPDEVFNVDDDGTDYYYGVGAQYDFNENVFVGFEYTILEADLSLNGVGSVDHEVKNISLSIGVKI